MRFFKHVSALFEFKRVEVKLPLTNLFVFEAVRGGLTLEENEGDICVDSVHIYTGKCSAFEIENTCTCSKTLERSLVYFVHRY